MQGLNADAFYNVVLLHKVEPASKLAITWGRLKDRLQ